VCQEIVREVERGLDFLATSQRDLPARHRSMRAVFEQSWRLLSDDERAVFKRLTVFRGGFSRDASEAVISKHAKRSVFSVQSIGNSQLNASREHCSLNTVHCLTALVDKSLLRRSPSGRYEIHELLRQYGEEKLSEPESVQVRGDHCRYFSEFLHTRENDLNSKKSAAVLEEIGEEIENVRAGWNWAIQQRGMNEIGQSLYSLYRYLEFRSRFREGEAVLGRAAEAVSLLAPEPEQQLVLARLYLYQGVFRHRLSRYSQAIQALEAGLAIFRRIDNPRLLYISLLELATIQVLHGSYIEAQHLLEEAVAGFREIAHQLNVCVAQVNLGYVFCQQGKYAMASELLTQALEGFQGHGISYYLAFAHYFLGLVAQGQSEFEKAAEGFRNGLSIFRDLENSWGVAFCLAGLASVAIQNSEYDQATQFAQEGLANAKKFGKSYVAALCLNALGQIACALEHNDEAKRYHRQAIQMVWEGEQLPPVLDGLIGIAAMRAKAGQPDAAAELLTLAINHPATIARDKDRAARLLAELETQLAPEAIAVARERGRALKLEEAVKRVVADE